MSFKKVQPLLAIRASPAQDIADIHNGSLVIFSDDCIGTWKRTTKSHTSDIPRNEVLPHLNMGKHAR